MDNLEEINDGDSSRQNEILDLLADSASLRKSLDLESEYRNVKHKIRMDRWRKIGSVIEAAAAVLLVPVTAALIFQLSKEDRVLEVRTNPGMTTKLTLSDGTVAHLNSSSSLTYPEKFKGRIREVKLDGEAFFDVTKDSRRQFIVSTPGNIKAIVHGTSFNMESYSSDTIASVTLISGRVDFSFDGKVSALLPGNKIEYNFNTGKTVMKKSDGKTETSWLEGKLLFDNTPFSEVLRMLAKRYNVEFVVKNQKYFSDSYTGSFTTHNLSQIMRVLHASSGLRWEYLDMDGRDARPCVVIY